MTTVEKAADKTVDKRRALGRGLDSLLPSGPRVVPNFSGPAASVSAPATAHPPASSRAEASQGSSPRASAIAPGAGGPDPVLHIPLDLIDNNPHQTRVEFKPEALQDLADSIRATGLIQPIVVRPSGRGRYLLVLGERRCRASKLAGKLTIPAIVREVSEQQAAEMTVIENLQRQDLNCMEQASAFGKLSREFGMTQEQIGHRVGISRESVANYMRLLKLPPVVVKYLHEGKLGFSEARSLLRIADMETLATIAEEAVQKGMSYLQLDELIEKAIHPFPPLEEKQSRGARWVDPNVRAAQAQLETLLGVRVRIADRKGKGKIVIEYATIDDFDRVFEMLKGDRAS